MLDQKQIRRHQRGRSRIFYAGREVLLIPLLRGGAGSYPDSPSRRMATNDDGTIGLAGTAGFPVGDGGSVTEATEAQMDTMNREGISGTPGLGLSNSGTSWVGYIFPELRELDGWHASLDDGGGWDNGIANSGDTTNGIDGTWTLTGSGIGSVLITFASGRNDIESTARSNIRGIRVKTTGASGGGGSVDKLHIYGEISAGETPDRLLWFNNDDDLEFSKPRDYGDIPRGSAEDQIVYLHNNSASLTASTVQITAEDLVGGSGAFFTFKEGAGSFIATLALASSIGSGADSPDITIRRITPDDADLGLHTARALVSVGSWA